MKTAALVLLVCGLALSARAQDMAVLDGIFSAAGADVFGTTDALLDAMPLPSTMDGTLFPYHTGGCMNNCSSPYFLTFESGYSSSAPNGSTCFRINVQPCGDMAERCCNVLRADLYRFEMEVDLACRGTVNRVYVNNVVKPFEYSIRAATGVLRMVLASNEYQVDGTTVCLALGSPCATLGSLCLPGNGSCRYAVSTGSIDRPPNVCCPYGVLTDASASMAPVEVAIPEMLSPPPIRVAPVAKSPPPKRPPPRPRPPPPKPPSPSPSPPLAPRVPVVPSPTPVPVVVKATATPSPSPSPVRSPPRSPPPSPEPEPEPVPEPVAEEPQNFAPGRQPDTQLDEYIAVDTHPAFPSTPGVPPAARRSPPVAKAAAAINPASTAAATPSPSPAAASETPTPTTTTTTATGASASGSGALLNSGASSSANSASTVGSTAAANATSGSTSVNISMPISKVITIACGVGVGLLGIAVLAGYISRKNKEAKKRQEVANAGASSVPPSSPPSAINTGVHPPTGGAGPSGYGAPNAGPPGGNFMMDAHGRLYEMRAGTWAQVQSGPQDEVHEYDPYGAGIMAAETHAGASPRTKGSAGGRRDHSAGESDLSFKHYAAPVYKNRRTTGPGGNHRLTAEMLDEVMEVDGESLDGTRSVVDSSMGRPMAGGQQGQTPIQIIVQTMMRGALQGQLGGANGREPSNGGAMPGAMGRSVPADLSAATVVRGADGQMITIPAPNMPGHAGHGQADMAGLPSIMGYTQGAAHGHGHEPSPQQRVAASAAFTEGLRKYLMAQRNATEGKAMAGGPGSGMAPMQRSMGGHGGELPPSIMLQLDDAPPRPAPSHGPSAFIAQPRAPSPNSRR